MKLIKSINLMENKKIIFWLNICSLVILIPFIAIFTLIAKLRVKANLEFELNSAIGLIIFIFSIFLILIVHELIHGIFFKIFNPESKVKFGFKNGMAYATSPNSYYSKLHFFIIGIAPFIVITTFLLILFFCGIISDDSFIFLSSIHASGCVGDFYWSYLLFRAPKNILVEDTEIGINFYGQSE